VCLDLSAATFLLCDWCDYTFDLSCETMGCGFRPCATWRHWVNIWQTFWDSAVTSSFKGPIGQEDIQLYRCFFFFKGSLNSSLCVTQPRNCVPSPSPDDSDGYRSPSKTWWAKTRNILTLSIPPRSDRRHPIGNALNTDRMCCLLSSRV